jgi:hypothetical protein
MIKIFPPLGMSLLALACSVSSSAKSLDRPWIAELRASVATNDYTILANTGWVRGYDGSAKNRRLFKNVLGLRCLERRGPACTQAQPFFASLKERKGRTHLGRVEFVPMIFDEGRLAEIPSELLERRRELVAFNDSEIVELHASGVLMDIGSLALWTLFVVPVAAIDVVAAAPLAIVETVAWGLRKSKFTRAIHRFEKFIEKGRTYRGDGIRMGVDGYDLEREIER